MKKYKKEDETSYSLGTELTLQLLIDKPECVNTIYVHSKQNNNDIYKRIIKLANDNKVEVIHNDRIFNVLSDKDNCYIIGVFNKYKGSINAETNHIVLVNPSNSGNLGTIIRTSIGFGIKDIAIITPAVDYFDPKVIRASMGAIFEANIQLFSTFEDYKKIATNRDIFTFMLDGKNRIDKIAIPDKYSLVFGNEATGLPMQYHNFGKSVLIKHYNTIDSLNLCNAVSIGLYKFTEGKVD